MSSAHVKSTEALESMRNALMRFKADTLNVLREVEIEIVRTQAWLQERLVYWQQELKRRKRKLEDAIAELRACEALAIAVAMASGGRAAPDCSPLQVAVARARRMVQEAEDEIRVVQTHIKRVEEAANSYRQVARQLNGALEHNLLKGAALLGNSLTLLQSYAGGSGASSIGSASISQIPSTIFALPTEIIGNTSLQMISIADIDLSDQHVKGSGDFIKGITPEQMGEGFHKLQDVVLPAVIRGEGDDYFAKLDASLGLENANGYLHIYHAFFYDINCIRLSKVRGRLTVDNGYHRLFIAQQLGITHIPARVITL